MFTLLLDLCVYQGNKLFFQKTVCLRQSSPSPESGLDTEHVRHVCNSVLNDHGNNISSVSDEFTFRDYTEIMKKHIQQTHLGQGFNK